MSLNANDPNVMLLETVAQHLGEEWLAALVFVGGAVAGLLITDPAMPRYARLRMWIWLCKRQCCASTMP